MKRILYFLLITFFLVSCKDDFDISKLQDSPRLVVYCFPAEGDTTLIAVTKSVPVAEAKGDRYALVSGQPVDAHIVYKVDGVEYPIKKIESEEEARHFCYYTGEHTLELMKGQYYAVGHQQAGNHISVEVSAAGFEPVSASTEIPQKMETQIDRIKVAEWDETSSDVNQVEMSFADEGSSKDYYAVKVNKLQMAGEAICLYKYNGMDKEFVDTIRVFTYKDYLATAKEYPSGTWNFDSLFLMREEQTIDAEKEPVLNKQTKLDKDLGFDGYEFFDNFYIFDDRLFNGKRYTLHMGLNTNEFNTYFSNFWDPLYGFTYIVELYKLTPEYYRFLSTINSAKSNSWAEAGIMQVTPTYSNVKGGFGVVAGFSVNAISRYIAPPKK